MNTFEKSVLTACGMVAMALVAFVIYVVATMPHIDPSTIEFEKCVTTSNGHTMCQ